MTIAAQPATRWSLAAAAAIAGFAAGPALAATFANPTSLALPGSGTSGPASLYPSAIEVSGLFGTITSITATLHNLSHTFPEDLGFLLVAPGGGSVVLFNGGVGGTDAVDVTLIFDDAAASVVPNPLVSGTWQPSDAFPTFAFPAPAPDGPHGTSFAALLGTDPNGTWSLFAHDFLTGDIGTLAGGWSLTIQTDGATVIPLPPAGLLLLSGLALFGLHRRRRAA